MQNSIKIIVYTLIVTILLLGSDYLLLYEASIISTILFFILILYLATFFKTARYFYLLFATLGFIHQIFFSYFQRFIFSSDIYNFFTHIDETFETIFGLTSLFILPIVIFLSILLILWILNKIDIKKYHLKKRIKCPLLLLLLFLNLNSSMSINLLGSLFSLPLNSNQKMITDETPIYPIKESNLNIVLILGESMKYDDYVEQKLKKQGYFYKKIYAGATNTDVSLPLLLNVKNNPLKLNKNNQTNLFKLAKKNNFTTAFISMQSKNSLKYIKPYLQIKSIDTYKSFSKHERLEKFDFFLLRELTKFNLSEKSFIVLQQIGQHSPYNFFEGKKSDNPSINYQKSVDYSFKLYDKIYTYLKQLQKPFVLIYTSDHGEFSGEDGKYGHNSFDPIIYEVPMFIVSNNTLTDNYKQIKSHHQLSQFLLYLLGYKKEFNLKDEKTIINGTMLSREDGFISIE